MAKITLFSQVIGKLPKEIIRKIIRTACTDKHCKGYDTWSQLVSMVFCQFSTLLRSFSSFYFVIRLNKTTKHY